MTETDPLFLPGQIVPQLGQLNFVHGTNLALLLGCYLLATTFDPSLLRTLLVAFVLILWLQLPILEVKDYVSILNESNFPRSFDIHIITTLITAAYVWEFSDLYQFTESVDMALLEGSDFLRNGVVVLLLLSWFGFLWQLEAEVDGSAAENPPESKNPRLSTEQIR